ncbi:glucokinase [Nakamurella sp. UYEF19]|uniref:ROK family protein n=1 Tax=Nakamurella sp. UYEF19 TaxID=1756392 RepID=UPI003391FE59
MDQVVAALDVGGTSIKAALVDRRGGLVHQTRRATGVANGPAAVVDGIVELAAELVETTGASVVGVGIGVPGTVDSEAGIARYAANLGWRDVPLVELIAERTKVPVALGHDVRTAVLAEARWGAGAGEGSMFFIAIGTGIAGGLARLGVVDDGDTGLSGEIGHLVVRPGGPACFCGNHGCLEAIASASRISTRYAALTGRADVSAEEIASLVRAGELAAQTIWGEAVDALADALAAATILMDPGRFVIGGGLSLAGDTLTDPLEIALAARLTFRPAPPVSLTVLGDRAGVMGAALRAWDHLDSPERRASDHRLTSDRHDSR